MKNTAITLLASACAVLTGCASSAPSIMNGPLAAMPAAQPAFVERVNNGAIYQQNMTMAALYNGRRKPRFVGDSLKVDIAESSSGSNTVKTATSRKNALASKGPGTASSSKGLINQIINLNATASGSDSYDGSGATSNATSFTGQIAATVINVLPNGNLVIAGERTMAMSNGVNTLRFSGIVDPKDFTQGNVVASTDVVNARLEVAGKGDVSEAGSRNWLQRVLTNSLSVW
ncbi:flagellar basal body L-ring protein FlgH [Xylophilus sp. GOD-11R]|uniref:flagellar basal body L-ring protein FlgH n=1 Tax=Xylophilus sp. GOD-11R TaxID=3089814 RepID=UPI00298C3F9B|nr:flagellar basal body L-ring protein FlgH [Xylophilus sp. GOD-11R]WPB55658.1 flagellar basal body L-ring protein FlgH [Xylophilus sp. GOD-11R]